MNRRRLGVLLASQGQNKFIENGQFRLRHLTGGEELTGHIGNQGEFGSGVSTLVRIMVVLIVDVGVNDSYSINNVGVAEEINVHIVAHKEQQHQRCHSLSKDICPHFTSFHAAKVRLFSEICKKMRIFFHFIALLPENRIFQFDLYIQRSIDCSRWMR